MNKVVLGKYTNTHGIKGEIKIKSNFKYKDRVFKIGNEIIIDKVYHINSYRVHKGLDMVTLKEVNDINEISFPKNSLVYIDKDKYLDNNEYLDNDLIGFKVRNSYLNLEVSDIRYLNDIKKLLVCNNKLIPFELIEKVDLEKHEIIIMEVSGL